MGTIDTSSGQGRSAIRTDGVHIQLEQVVHSDVESRKEDYPGSTLVKESLCS